MKNLISEILEDAAINNYETMDAHIAAYLILGSFQSAIVDLEELIRLNGGESIHTEWLERLHKILIDTYINN